MSEIDLDRVEMLVAITPSGQAKCLVCGQTAVNAHSLRGHDCECVAATEKVPRAAQSLMDHLADVNQGALADQSEVASDAIGGVLSDLGVVR